MEYTGAEAAASGQVTYGTLLLIAVIGLPIAIFFNGIAIMLITKWIAKFTPSFKNAMQVGALGIFFLILAAIVGVFLSVLDVKTSTPDATGATSSSVLLPYFGFVCGFLAIYKGIHLALRHPETGAGVDKLTALKITAIFFIINLALTSIQMFGAAPPPPAAPTPTP